MTDVKNIKAIIFDLDGVLLSTDKYHYMAWKELADKLGIPFCEKDNEAFRGVSRMDCMEILVSKRSDLSFTEEQKIAYANEKNEKYRKLLENITPSFVSDEVRHTLRVLRERGYKLAVGSSSKNSRLILDKTALTDCFDAIVDGNDISRSKPDPEVFVKAAAVGFAPCECAVIEDAEAGLEAAVGGGLPVGMGEARNSPKAEMSLPAFGTLEEMFLGV